MNQEEFESKFHWMNGLSEYFRYTGQEDKYEPIFKALYHNNYYRKRDIIMHFIEHDYGDLEDVPYSLRRAWINMLLNNHLPDVEVKVEIMTSMLATLVDDSFTHRISRFIDYFIFDNNTDVMLPDLGDFLSRGQVKSKLWLITELSHIIEGPIGNVVFYGGWYNFTAYFLFSQFDVNKIYSLDVDRDVIEPSKRLYPDEVKQNRFLPKAVNVNKVIYRDDGVWIPADDGSEWLLADKINMVVNTSCEHMDSTWFDNLPEGTFVVLQTNDYFENPQHSNCCKDLEDAKSKYPMQNIFYAGELDTHLYNRFMLIGIK